MITAVPLRRFEKPHFSFFTYKCGCSARGPNTLNTFLSSKKNSCSSYRRSVISSDLDLVLLLKRSICRRRSKLFISIITPQCSSICTIKDPGFLFLNPENLPTAAWRQGSTNYVIQYFLWLNASEQDAPKGKKKMITTSFEAEEF